MPLIDDSVGMFELEDVADGSKENEDNLDVARMELKDSLGVS